MPSYQFGPWGFSAGSTGNIISPESNGAAMKEIHVEQITRKGNNIVDIEITPDHYMRRFFNENKIKLKYDVDISKVPDSILVIPAMTTLLPVAWVEDADIKVNSLDSDFHNSIDQIKEGYSHVYPQLIQEEGRSSVHVENIVDNSVKEIEEQSAMTYTGGVDTSSTYLRHAAESPDLINISISRQSPVKERHRWSESVWENKKESVRTFARKEKVDAYFIESNIYTAINRLKLNLRYSQTMGRTWWQGMQFGIGFLGSIAPLAYEKDITKIYMASGFGTTDDQSFPQASQPKMVDPLIWGNTHCEIDGQDLTRQQKVEYIAENIPDHMEINTCTNPEYSENCCSCKKCYVGIIAFAVAGINPKSVGYDVDSSILDEIKKAFDRSKIDLLPHRYARWEELQNKIDYETFYYNNNSFVDWFKSLNIKLVETENPKNYGWKGKLYKSAPYPADYILYKFNSHIPL